MTEGDRLEAKFVNRLFLGLFFLIMFISIGTAVAGWQIMDCRLTLGQQGRSVADIKEICK